jgi:hypothetical protein
MSLTSRIKSAIELFKSAGRIVTGRGSAVASMYLQQLARMFVVSPERNRRHTDMDTMDKNDPIVKFSHDTIANRATGMEDPTLDCFQVAVEADTAYDFPADESTVSTAQSEVNGVIRRTNLRPEMWQTGRRTVKYGDEFREVLFDGDTIVGLKLLPEHTMWPLMDDKGNRIPGYEQRLVNNAEAAIIFGEFEIVHFSFGEQDGYLGTPMFGCVRKDWKRLNACLDMMVFARLSKSFARWIHHVPVNTNDSPDSKQKTIDAYKEKTTKAPMYNTTSESVEKWEVPEGLMTNHYVTDDGSGKGKVEMLDPQNAQLQHLADIEHILDRVITASGIPKRYFPFEGSTPKLSEGGGSAEDKHFACTLMFVQMILKKGLAEIFDRQLILKGIDPRSVRYVIRMADISTSDQMRNAQTQVALARVAEIWLKQYPELREFMKISDPSSAALSTVKVEPKPEPVVPTAIPVPDGRVQLPGEGEPAGRMKV